VSDAAPAAGTLRTRTLERCLACGGGRLQPLAMRYEYRGADFPLVECRDCGIRFLSVQPVGESLAGLYDEPYFQADYRCGRATTSSFEGEAFAAESRGQVDAFEARARPGRLLEVGCASGWLLRHAAERGWRVMGVEPSPAAAAFARSLGLEVFQGALEDARLPDARFDVVYMGDVLEHVPDCRATLLEVARVLAPDGWLFLRGPITTHSLARALGLRLYGLLGRSIVLREPPYHLWEFRPRPLTRLVRSVGLEPRELRQSKIPPGRAHGAKTGLQRAAMSALDAVNAPLTRVFNARGDRATLVARKPASTLR
jgi:SAM-dependent methyltransferase